MSIFYYLVLYLGINIVIHSVTELNKSRTLALCIGACIIVNIMVGIFIDKSGRNFN